MLFRLASSCTSKNTADFLGRDGQSGSHTGNLAAIALPDSGMSSSKARPAEGSRRMLELLAPRVYGAR